MKMKAVEKGAVDAAADFQSFTGFMGFFGFPVYNKSIPLILWADTSASIFVKGTDSIDVRLGDF